MKHSRSPVWGAAIFVGVLVSTAPAFSQSVIKIGSSAELEAALKTLQKDTILDLAPGDYGKIFLREAGGEQGAPVVIRSADPANKAKISGLDLRQVSHIELKDLAFEYTYADAQELTYRPFQAAGGENLIFKGNIFKGDTASGLSPIDDGYPSGFGLVLSGVSGALVEGNEIKDFYRASMIYRSKDVVIRGNDIHSIRMDGLTFAEVSDLLIENNIIRDFKRNMASGDHADMIQFWTARTKKPSTNITIRDNILNSGHGHYTQSIFMRNELVDTAEAGEEMFYDNVLIENNVIINAHLHGITLGETNDLTIRNNSVLRNARSEGKQTNPGLWTPQIRVASRSTRVTIERNVTSQISGYSNQPDWTVASNYLVQDRFPGQPGFYDNVFVAARTGDPTDLSSFTSIVGGDLDGKDLGADRLNPSRKNLPAGQQMRPVARIIEDPDFRNRYRFEAVTSGLPEGVKPEDVVYSWDLGDGTQATGVEVAHSYKVTGPIRVVLTATLQDGQSFEVENTVHIKGPTVLEFSTETGDFVSYAERDPYAVPNLVLGRGPAVLGQGVAPIMLPPSSIKPFFQSSDFELSLRVRGIGTSRAAGELLRIHRTLVVTVTPRGIMEIRFDTENAEALKLKTSVVQLFSGEWVDLVFAYSASQQRFTVTANGRVIGQGRTFGQLRPLEHWGLSLGNPFANRKSFDGELGGLVLKANQETYLD